MSRAPRRPRIEQRAAGNRASALFEEWMDGEGIHPVISEDDLSAAWTWGAWRASAGRRGRRNGG